MTGAGAGRWRLGLLGLALLAGALGSVIGGLSGDVLRTGRLDPLDWGLPMLLGMILPALWLWWRRVMPSAAVLTALAATFLLPPAALVAWAGTRPAELSLMALLALLIVGVMLLRAGLCARLGWPMRPALALATASALAALALSALAGRAPAWPGGTTKVAILSALPLHGARAAADGGFLAAPAGRSALDAVLLPAIRLQPIDAVDEAGLRGVDVLLLAQPRALAPAELARLDQWVRTGKRVVILADPDLRWASRYPMAHPLAPPPASLLGPLLQHWGLRMQPAADRARDPLVRRALSGGGLAQFVAPGRLVAVDGPAAARCALGDAGMTAACAVGRGSATIVADADWIHPDLWTLTPRTPQDRHQWTADAPDLLAGWLLGKGSAPALSDPAFLRDIGALVVALRVAMILAIALAGLTWIVIRAQIRLADRPIPTPAQTHANTKPEQVEESRPIPGG